MITLTVVSFNGSPSDSALSARFDELGGTIGRADTNQLVLPDPDRTISRVHAQVVFRGGSFAVIDRGSNPVLVNGQPVGNGRERALQQGDQLQIGGYLLSVERSAAAAPAAPLDPFADLLGPAAAPAPGRGLFDPLASYGAEASPQTTPGFYPRPKPSAPSAPKPAAAAGGIPDDWDPFAPDPVPAAPLGGLTPRPSTLGLDGGAAAAPLIPDLGGSGGGDSSLDQLFGLKAGVGDPLANSMLGEAAARPNMAAHADPLQSLRSAPQASGPAAQDDLSALQQPFIAAPRAPAPAAAPAAAALPSGAVLSWDKADAHTVIRPAQREAEVEVDLDLHLPPLQAAAPAPMPAPAPAPRPVAPPTASAASAASAGSADTAALLAGLREGLAMPQLQLDALTPELMRLIGQLLREAASGTVDLLVARAALKREVRAESTMIVARENNPLKFSPTAEAALQHLLSPPTRGFMPAAPAMRDAYDDLRAHQFGFIAGMRAALEGVLQRFDPNELEGRLSERSGLLSLLPGSRKARMWEVFVEHYAQISGEAEDDFHSLFGRAFLKAYEEHIDQLKGGAS